MEGIGNHRRTQQKAHLVARHADCHGLDILVFELVALLNIDLVHAGAAKEKQNKAVQALQKFLSDHGVCCVNSERT